MYAKFVMAKIWNFPSFLAWKVAIMGYQWILPKICFKRLSPPESFCCDSERSAQCLIFYVCFDMLKVVPDGSNLFDQTVFDQTNLMFDQTNFRQTSQGKSLIKQIWWCLIKQIWWKFDRLGPALWIEFLINSTQKRIASHSFRIIYLNFNF